MGYEELDIWWGVLYKSSWRFEGSCRCRVFVYFSVCSAFYWWSSEQRTPLLLPDLSPLNFGLSVPPASRILNLFCLYCYFNEVAKLMCSLSPFEMNSQRWDARGRQSEQWFIVLAMHVQLQRDPTGSSPLRRVGWHYSGRNKVTCPVALHDVFAIHIQWTICWPVRPHHAAAGAECFKH